MKIHGKKIHVPGIAYAVIPRPENVGGDIIFTCQSVLSYEEFEALCPTPEAPWVRHRSGKKQQDYDDKRFVKARGDWATKRQAWMVIQSIKATPGVEWETVEYGNPETWENYTTELEECGFSPMEVARIVDAVYEACGLSRKKIDEAMERFLSGERAKAQEESSREDEANATSSSEPASVSA